MVTVSTPISIRLTESRVMTGPSKTHRSTITKPETLSTANSRHSISRAQVSSRLSTNSSSNPSQDTATKGRVTVQDRELHLSTHSISRVKVSSIPHIDPHNPPLALKHKDLTLTNRVSTETTSSKDPLPSPPFGNPVE